MNKLVKTFSLILPILTFGLSIVSSIVEMKQMEELVDDRVKAALSQQSKEI